MRNNIKMWKDKKLLVSSLVISCIFTIFTLTGIWTRENLDFSTQTGAFLLWFLVYFGVYFILILYIFNRRKNIKKCKLNVRVDAWIDRNISLKREFMFVSLGLSIIYVLALLAFFLGFSDMMVQ